MEGLEHLHLWLSTTIARNLARDVKQMYADHQTFPTAKGNESIIRVLSGTAASRVLD
jgi:hypothetical protein